MDVRAERKVVFDGNDLVVVSIENGRDCGVITFGPWLLNPLGLASADQSRGFIERAFERQGLDELHVIPRRNHWYNCAEIDTALALAAKFAASRRVVTCGSSMGGYGASLFSAQLNVQSVSISPQFSLSPEFAPFETRWRDEFESIEKFDSEAMFRDGLASGYIFYDPFTKLDAQQANLFRNRSNYIFVPCSFSGHATVAMINKVYGLPRMVAEAVDNRFVLRDILDARRLNRKDDDLYLSLLYIQACEQGHISLSESLKLKLKNNEKILGLKALNSLVAFSMRRRDVAGAAVWANIAVGCDNKRPDEFLMVSKMLQRVGETQKAINAINSGLLLAPDNAVLKKEFDALKDIPV